MIKIKTFVSGILSNNTYLIFNDRSIDKKEGVIIDPTGCFASARQYIIENNIELKAVMLTHGHFDHVIDVPKWQRLGIRVFAHKQELFNLNSDRTILMLKSLNLPPITIDEELSEKNYVFEGIPIDVLHTPGHTKGSCCFVVGNNVFSGDTLFFNSFGRTDFPDGDFNQMKCSLKKLFTFSEQDYNVFPGHEDFSSLNYERTHNPILMYF
ncbi:MAG TPA: MBL fold metallo-hydrolase [Clostridia bacterium]|nr:MBL fold metallo-hydrolase [Clostridia bacterium]